MGTARLLDLGCGTAGMSIAGTRQYGEVIGVDVALRWLVMGQQRLREEGVDVSLVCANAESLPFHSGIFDAIVADAVMEHVNNPGAMRDETLRVINQTGAFLFTTNNRFSLLREPHLRLWGLDWCPGAGWSRLHGAFARLRTKCAFSHVARWCVCSAVGRKSCCRNMTRVSWGREMKDSGGHGRV